MGVSTRTIGSVSLIGLSRLEDSNPREPRIFSVIDGPVSSNRLGPPTKHTAIFEFTNSSLGSELEVAVVAARV
ncbi:hypothetical protein F2Q69_00024994 [Brassica cretica]|uniref:Uncharacterized protein n=1 Tax=Brassica cretica TaxID=69181 RepID=A0A8S9Q800_BRACR|nr:hypothetical protein F2Q69_00024994 [Brassica cretica]